MPKIPEGGQSDNTSRPVDSDSYRCRQRDSLAIHHTYDILAESFLSAS